MWGWLARVPKKHPFAFGVILCGVKNAGCDYAMQRYVQRKEEIDWRRVRVFGTFGMIFNGAWQYALFVRCMPAIFPGAAAFAAKPLRLKLQDRVGMRNLFLQCAIENGINNPLLYFPTFYVLKEHIEGGPWQDGLMKYKKNWKEDVVAIWKVWIPAQLFNFAFCPMWLRVPFVACLSAAWTSYVSITRGEPEPVE